ncbi:hypothetical protein EJB05_11934, partial [Eragrostis curvula]
MRGGNLGEEDEHGASIGPWQFSSLLLDLPELASDRVLRLQELSSASLVALARPGRTVTPPARPLLHRAATSVRPLLLRASLVSIAPRAQKCIGGERESNFTLPLSSYTKMDASLHTLLEMDAWYTVAREEPKIALPCAVEVSLMAQYTHIRTHEPTPLSQVHTTLQAAALPFVSAPNPRSLVPFLPTPPAPPAIPSPVRPTISCRQAMESQRPPPSLTADLLREIFLRVASSSDLARASAACVYFCRIIADPSFLRRYRSLHRTLLLGSIGPRGLDTVKAPHPNAAAARAFTRTVDFSFRYLPRECGMCDIRDGRVLATFIDYDKNIYLWDLALCNPLSRTYQLVPPLPTDLLASFQLEEHYIETFLVPSEDVEDTSFKLLSCMISETTVVLFIFSSGSGCWSVGTSTGLDSLGLDEPQESPLLSGRCYVYGCFYWKVDYTDKFLKLDMNTMRFTTYDLPPDHADRSVAIVEAEGGMLGMFSQIDQGTSLDYYTFLPNGSTSKKGGEWHLKNTVPLPSNYKCHMTSREAEGHIFLSSWPKHDDISDPACFSLDTKAFKIERLYGIVHPYFFHPYFCFPPIIPPRRIEAYDARGK